MKLVIITAVEEYERDVLKMFRQANIENFSSSDIDGHKNAAVLTASSWFPSIKGGNESQMFFSFTEERYIDQLFEIILEFNERTETSNPVRGIVLPIEKFI
jgi:hypothetical protein